MLAFPDINPQAPTHVLVIPKQHIDSHAEAAAGDTDLLGHLLWAVGEVARAKNLGRGYRLVINTGPDSGQTVDHLHLHLLGGRPCTGPRANAVKFFEQLLPRITAKVGLEPGVNSRGSPD